MDFRDITEKNISCWYGLSWQESPPAIILRIHKDFIEKFKTKHPSEEWPIVRMLEKEFGFEEFSANFDRDIGFERVFRHTGEKNGFIEYAAEIPIIQKLSNEPCLGCEGSGTDELRDGDPCLLCKGTGKKQVMDWHTADAISASFTVFTTILSPFNLQEDTYAVLPQLLTIKTITHKDMHGGSLDGEISIPLRKFLSSLGDNATIPEMIKAMRSTHERMFGVNDYDVYSFKVYVRSSGTFIADCPGNACGIHPSDWHLEEGKGYELSCHNVDTSGQQITLIAGLAALCDKARREMKI